jgi:hypothetical protein
MTLRISRRAALACGAALCLMPTAALADAKDATYNNGLCTAGLDAGSADPVRQLKPHWCWAACIQTIFATHGFHVAQQRIVEKVFGNEIDQSANAKEILSAIDGRWIGERGQPFEAEGFVLWDRVANFERSDALELAVAELEGGNPLIFANERHAMVLTSMIYSKAANGGISVESLIVRDPWPDAPLRHTLAAGEVARSGLLCGVHVLPAMA